MPGTSTAPWGRIAGPPRLTLRPLAISAAARAALGGGEAVVRARHRLGVTLALPGCPGSVFLSGPGVGLLPAHVVVRARDLVRVHAALGRLGDALRGASLRLGLDLDGVRTFRPRLSPLTEALRSAPARAGVAEVARWLRADATPLGLGATATDLLAGTGRWAACLAPLRHGAAPSAPSLRAIVGRGAGSTPAGDDLVVGALARAWATEGRGAPVVAAMRTLDGELDALTTMTGATYLRAATRGEFGSHLVAWVRALPRVPASRSLALARRVARHGATSGCDTLVGFLVASGPGPAPSDRAVDA